MLVDVIYFLEEQKVNFIWCKGEVYTPYYCVMRKVASPRSLHLAMGNLLRILWKPEEGEQNNFYVDFETVDPSEEERPVYESVQKVLDDGRVILKDISQYTGATEHIREIYTLSVQKVLDDGRVILKDISQYTGTTEHIQRVVQDLLEVLCSKDKTPSQHLETQQALFKQFADILDFVLRFDDRKMTNPAIQNDFSYYRRTLSRMKLANEDETGNENIVSNEMANRMSLFYAPATPMLKVLSDATTKFVSQHKELPVENTTECLSTMAKICRVMIETPEYVARFQSGETKLFCLRVMVGVIILYDHVHPVGAFAKNSSIDLKSCIKVLKEQDAPMVEGLINALRFTTKHLNEEGTPKSIKALLAV
ncbi:hypothetical protein FSP39_007916 [Pinctada imbricata]|uniref:CYRIA/CYRIB Rac1 binding domain-containing protein n=1 Tax=Pinctada imbricata TaxID=66713 RepID=A0AA89BNY4_PINIB|nr:hypothetical protein FSP39_007916 [Pinctada imbricata]